MLALLLKPLSWIFITILGRIFNNTVVERGAAYAIFNGLDWLSSKTTNHLDEQLVGIMRQAYYGASSNGPSNPTDSSNSVSSVDHNPPSS